MNGPLADLSVAEVDDRVAESGVVAANFVLRPAVGEDAQWMADLKADAMRADLERLGYWDRDWARSRFLDAYVSANTSIIQPTKESRALSPCVQSGTPAGSNTSTSMPGSGARGSAAAF